ncbi:hypothetical protein Gogos_002316, partial [Gossypium gossypioides]|nr:hypothetical protein [Gossypium gossypioides]
SILGKCSVFVAELWGILDGLLLLQKQGYDEIVIQSDNLEKWFLRYVPRKSNKVVDAITKMTFTNNEDLHMFDVPPITIQEALKEDNTGDNLFINKSM